MVDIALIVFSSVVPFVLLFANLVIMAKFIDPQAAAGHYIAKLTILLGMLLAECTILLLPLDVGNRSGVVGCGYWNDGCGGLNLTLVWQIVYGIIAGLVVIVFPFFIFYYEADDEGMGAEEANPESCMARCCDFRNFKRSFLSAFCYTCVTVVIAAIAWLVSYNYLANTHLPYKLVSVSVSSSSFAPAGTPVLSLGAGTTAAACFGGGLPGIDCLLPCGDGTCAAESKTISMKVTLLVYLAALMSFVGWFIFSIYVGIGMIALPLDCFNSFRHRPKVLSVSEARAQRKQLLTRSTELLRLGEALAGGIIEFHDEVRSKRERRKKGKIDTQEMNRFRVLVDLLEHDLEEFQLCDPQNYREHYNPLVPYAKLVGGLISVILTGLWLAQIIVYMLFSPPLDPLLNTYFIQFDSWFPLFGTISIAVFGLYLLLCAAKGNVKFGTRFFLIKVHPMEAGKTLMNSFLFNVGLVLLCTLPAVQFCTDAFSEYVRLTDADSLFGSQFKNLEFFRYFWQYNVFMFMILGFALLTLIYLAIWPSDRDHLNKVMQAIKAKKAGEMKNLDRKLQQQGGALSALESSGTGRSKNR